MPQLLSIAEIVDKLHAICVICGNPASRNQRLIGGKPARYDSPTIMVGSTESYEARCRACHSVPRRDEDQVRLLKPHLVLIGRRPHRGAYASVRNSSRVRWSDRNRPRTALVIVLEFCFSTPRIIMQRW